MNDVVAPVVAVCGAAFALGSAVHALLNKRDPRSALGWLVVCVMVPVVGAIAYWLLGVNRIRMRTRARRWQASGRFELGASGGDAFERSVNVLSARHPDQAEHLAQLLQISRRVTGRPLLDNNRVEPLYNGEQAYPAMLEAIRAARHHIYLSTYLWDAGGVGTEFVDALGEAAARGVDVRVLIDAIGERYARPRVSRLLKRRRGIKVARFLPLTLSLRGLRLNLRNHRKILSCDGEVGFTGGMNIGDRHLVELEGNKKPTTDVQFRITGPAVFLLEEVFFDDWHFTTGDEDWPGWKSCPPAGEALCRGIKDGPNEDFEKLAWILIGALTCARKSIRIMTPYFVPDRGLLSVITAAALRGVQVDIVLPERNNLPYVKWASQAMLWELVQHDVRIYYQPPPFCHTKLLTVDDLYVNIGSANLDPRSLRLNFEFNLEVYEPALATALRAHFDGIVGRSRRVTLDWLERRSFAAKLRDSAAKLLSPYL